MRYSDSHRDFAADRNGSPVFNANVSKFQKVNIANLKVLEQRSSTNQLQHERSRTGLIQSSSKLSLTQPSSEVSFNAEVDTLPVDLLGIYNSLNVH